MRHDKQPFSASTLRRQCEGLAIEGQVRKSHDFIKELWFSSSYNCQGKGRVARNHAACLDKPSAWIFISDLPVTKSEQPVPLLLLNSLHWAILFVTQHSEPFLKVLKSKVHRSKYLCFIPSGCSIHVYLLREIKASTGHVFAS